MVKVCVVGLGYIGLPTALLLAKNHDVFGCDINEEIISQINKKETPFFEPGIDELIKNSNIEALNHPVDADAFIICVPTPFDKELKMADLKSVKNAVISIVPYLKPGKLVVVESTIPPGTCEKLVKPILGSSGLNVDSDLFLSHCPERAIPGRTLYEMVNNDRIIGGMNQKSTDLTVILYKSFVKGKIYKTNIRTAEFVKLIENTFRDVNIALANELAMIAEDMDINIWESIALANKHPRVNILLPGPGVGGHCIAVDPRFLTESSINSRLINVAREINENMPLHVFLKIKKIFASSNILNPTITIFGVAYKGNIDDTRETPALKLINLIEKEGYNFKIFDPIVKKWIYTLSNFENAVRNSDMVVIVTDHTVFKTIYVKRLSELVKNKIILDTRNIINRKEFLDSGFKIYTLGRENV